VSEQHRRGCGVYIDAGSCSKGKAIMKDLVWDKILSVGVDEIDDDHRRLLDLFNLLNHAVGEGGSPELRAAVLEELINCTAWHFSHEERLMLQYGYVGLAAHREEHRELMRSVRELQQKILQAGSRMAEEDLVYLERWLTQHILTDDAKLGSYLVQAM
jgi:hemerythrin-like metal-binding protein